MPKKIVGIMMAVALIAALVPSLNAQTDTLLIQGFETTPFPPTNWYQVINNTVVQSYPGTWYRGNYPTTGFFHGTYGCLCWWSNGAQNEWMVTPQLDLTGYQANTHQVFLRFSSAFYRTTATTLHNYICVSSNNGSNWQDTIDDPIHTVAGSGWVYIDDNPNPLLYDISDHIGQTIRIGWNYYYNAGGGSRGVWSFDDVLVTAVDTTSGAPGGDSLDLEMVTIIRPNTEEQGGVAFTPGCKIFNNLDTVVVAEVRARLTDLSNMQVVYDKVLSNYPCDPGYTTCQAFPDFTPEGGKEYKALFVVTNENDINPANDNLEKNWFASLGIDITPIEILAPADNQINAFKPSARYAERAGKAMTANLICKIEGGAFNAILFTDTLSHDFAAYDTFTAEFKDVTGLEDGSYSITFWAENPLDASNISKPEATKDFGYDGIAEKPQPTKNELSVSGRSVNFSIAKESVVSLKVYDAAGNLVTTIASGSMAAGSHVVTWTARPGVYFVKLVTPDYSAVRKATVLN